MVRASAAALVIAATTGCASKNRSVADRSTRSRHAVEVTFQCVDMMRGRTMGAAIVRGKTSAGVRYSEPQYDVSRSDARKLARRLHARFMVEC
jgi:hypothetical protein